jgi:hypothetical protein
MNATEGAIPTPISGARSLDEVAEYWDSHSVADHWDETREVSIDVRAQRRYRINLDPDVFGDVRTQARQRGVAVETLVNLWLKERLATVDVD